MSLAVGLEGGAVGDFEASMGIVGGSEGGDIVIHAGGEEFDENMGMVGGSEGVKGISFR